MDLVAAVLFNNEQPPRVQRSEKERELWPDYESPPWLFSAQCFSHETL
jgi:hypothetical protein